jgi:hypothetical protein
MSRSSLETSQLTRIIIVAVSLLGFPATSSPQLVPVKTIPVAAGDQFLLFPSTNMAMGGGSLAFADTLGDPFANPATGSRLKESFFFGSPTFYHISGRNGSGRTLPVGTLFRSGEWFGGGAVSLQEVEGAKRERWLLTPWSWGSPPPQILSEGSARNLYALGILGQHFPQARLSVGISGFWADLGAMDGVDLLYAMSQEIQQSGHLSDLRIGVLKEWEGDRSLEALILRSKLRMTHDVTYVDLLWPPAVPDEAPFPVWVPRTEKNLDHTDTWGAHVVYRRPLSAPGWKMAWSLTGNWNDHPKIPNYEIQNIPRDPGNTRAYGLGVGLSKVEGPTRLGLDLVLEPIRSETWAEAAGDTISVTGDIMRAGEKTVENDFRFTNVLVRAGGSWDFRWATFRGGVKVRSISYELEQFNRVEAVQRNQDESWMEWSPSLGISLDLGGAVLHYAGRLTTGTGRPGVQWAPERAAMLDLAAEANFILAPSGPLTLQDARVTTHQISVVIPIR